MELPSYLLNVWRIEHSAEVNARRTKQLKGWTASSLAEAHMKYQLGKHIKNVASGKFSISGLYTIAAGKILELLECPVNRDANVKTISEGLSSIVLRQLLHDPRMPYQLLRLFLTQPQCKPDNRAIADIDDAVLRHERYVRTLSAVEKDGSYLVSLEDLYVILRKSYQDGSPLVFTRKDPPKGGLEVLDELRQRTISTHSTSAAYCSTFDRITNGILRGLDWNHVLLAGGMALMTLLHTNSRHDDDHHIKDPDLDMYIYGLGPEDANQKVQQIYNTWIRNLPATSGARLVVKNAKTITFLTSYPNRRIQIVLKLLPSPTDVLLNFDLDACAIGFDGAQVSMLPRCARAIETGYSVFTMDLVWGHHLGNRRASQDERIFKYAERGFGIRFLPSYARSLEEDNLETSFLHESKPEIDNELVDAATIADDHNEAAPPVWAQRERKPNGREPGLKTLKRVAYLGQDYVHRYYFGTTPLAISPARYRKDVLGEQGDTNNAEDEEWQRLYRQTEKRRTQPTDVPLIDFAELDSRQFRSGGLVGPRGLKTLEVFMRHCEAWRLHVRGEARLCSDSNAEVLVYDLQEYDDVPTYTWDEAFDARIFANDIDDSNDLLWSSTREAICAKLSIPSTASGFANYSTRRIRRQVYGHDLATVQEKQITIPLVMPWSLENFLLTMISQHLPPTPSHTGIFSPIIPVHDSSKYDPRRATLPSLRDTSTDSGNLRYWVITNETMWAGQDKALDEFAELMWVLFCWFVRISSLVDSATRMSTDREACTWHLARSFRSRNVLPEVSETAGDIKPGLPALREALLFRRWALTSPPLTDRDRNGELVDDDGQPIPTGKHKLFSEEGVLYPFPDELFWQDGDEGEWDGDSVPLWVDVD